MKTELEQHVISEFSGDKTQEEYIKKAEDGLWDSEKYFIEKYFTNKSATLLDIGCGTGRTTFPLFRQGFRITGVDLVPAMIENAKKVAHKLHLDVDFREGDATALDFKDGSFDYALFSNQGWSQIPGRDKRLKALAEICRVLKKDGTFIFTAHPRWAVRNHPFFWLKQWIKLYLLKPLGFKIMEEDFGDRFFDRGTIGGDVGFKKQYIHIPTVKEVQEDIKKAGLTLIESDGNRQISKNDIRKFPPVFYVCRK